MEQASGIEELRGVWITNVDSDVLTSKRKIAEMMDYLASRNFNVVYPVVWNKAMTMYPSDVMEEEFGVRIDPLYGDRDPLQELITEAHRVGIEVVPWFEFGFASSYNAGGGPLLQARPEWKALDQDGNLVKKNNFEWMNAFDPEVQDFMKSLVLEVCEKYDIDGIQGDDRLPAVPTLAGYDEYTKSLYRAEYGEDPPLDVKDEQWVRFRADILTEFFRDLREEVKAIDPNIIISSSPSYYDWSLYEYLQDSYTWTNEGIVDTIHPQAYRYDVPAYQAIVDDLVENQFTSEQLEILSPGILLKSGSYVADTEYIGQAVEYNRMNGINGEVYFFYPGLRENDNEIGDFLHDQFYQDPASLFYRNGQVWRPKAITSTFPASEVSDAWGTNSDYPGAYRRPGGEMEMVTWDIDVPVKGHYDLYVYSLAGALQSETVQYQTDNKTTTFDQSNPDHYGWMHLGLSKLNKGINEDAVTLNVIETDSEKFIISGSVMAILNRKHSGDIPWEW